MGQIEEQELMIVLTTPPPGNMSEFVACVRGLLAQGVSARGDAVQVAGEFPAMSGLTIDVTGATPVDRPAGRWLDGAAGGDVVSEFSVESLRVIGRPLGDAARPIEIDVSARRCRGQFARTPDGAVALRMAGAEEGRLVASVARSTVERIAMIEAGKAARAQGVEIKDVQVAWRSEGPRDLSVEVQVKAKKGFLPAAVIRVRGRVAIDASLTVTVSGLSVEGEGMVGSMAAGLIRPKLMQAEGMSKSLLGLPLDELRIKDVRLGVMDDKLSVEGEFGSVG
jgi:hypothetical protein